MIELIHMKELILFKVITVNNALSAITGFLIMGFNSKIIFVMVVMIWHCCVLMILEILLLLLLKVLVITVLQDIGSMFKNYVFNEHGYIENACQKNQHYKYSTRLTSLQLLDGNELFWNK